MKDHITLANDTTKICIPYFPDQNPTLPVYEGKMGILRVKRDSPFYQNIMMLTKNNTMHSCVLLGRYTKTVTLMRKMWVRRTAER